MNSNQQGIDKLVVVFALLEQRPHLLLERLVLVGEHFVARLARLQFLLRRVHLHLHVLKVAFDFLLLLLNSSFSKLVKYTHSIRNDRKVFYFVLLLAVLLDAAYVVLLPEVVNAAH